MAAVGFNLMLGKRALSTDYLAATAQTATATDRINIHAQYPRCMEQRRVDRKTAAPTRGGKDYLDHVLHCMTILFCDVRLWLDLHPRQLVPGML